MWKLERVWDCVFCFFFGKFQLGVMKTHFNSIKFTDELTGINTRWLGGEIMRTFTVFFM